MSRKAPPASPAGDARLPAATRRLFPHHRLEDLESGGDLLVGRLLEDGDSHDLAWLSARVGRELLVRWLRRRGGRQLSRRSRAFWSLVLEAEPGAGGELSEELWSP